MSGTSLLEGDTAYSTKAILLPATLNCLLSVSCLVMLFSACVSSTWGRPQSCNSCFCSFLSFILPPAAKIACLAFFFHLNFPPDRASAASHTSAAQHGCVSRKNSSCPSECMMRDCRPETLRRVGAPELPPLQAFCRVSQQLQHMLIQAGSIAL